MKIINMGRGQGKTTKLIKISSERKIPIVCTTVIKKRIIEEMAKEMDLKIPEPIEVDILLRNKDGYRNRYETLLIDDLKEILSKIMNSNISFVTTSCEVIEGELSKKEKWCKLSNTEEKIHG